MSEDGRVLGWIENDRGWARLHLRDLDTGSDLPEPQLPAGSISPAGSALRLAPDGAHAALVWQGPQHPPDLYAIETATGKARKLTESMLGGLRPRQLVEPELDLVSELRRPRHPRVALPARSGVAGRRSCVSIHGGPESQERPVYQPLYQYLVSRGIAVLATNIRGSSGYGKTYQKLIHHDWGGGDVRDWDHAVKWLHEQDWVNRRPDRASGAVRTADSRFSPA